MALKRRGISVLVIAGLLVLGLVGAYFVVDSMIRHYAENRVRQEISSSLPANVTGDVNVSIGGMSVIAQYLAGNFERVELRAPGLVVDDVPASVHIVATDVPTDPTKTVGAVHGTIDMGEDALNTLLASAGVAGNPELKLHDGAVTYAGTLSLLGTEIGYRATAIPAAAGDSVVFNPTAAEITTGIGNLNLSGLMQHILGEAPISLCVAQYLPVGVDVTGVNVTPDRARFTLESHTLKLTEESLGTMGSCAAA